VPPGEPARPAASYGTLGGGRANLPLRQTPPGPRGKLVEAGKPEGPAGSLPSPAPAPTESVSGPGTSYPAVSSPQQHRGATGAEGTSWSGTGNGQRHREPRPGPEQDISGPRPVAEAPSAGPGKFPATSDDRMERSRVGGESSATPPNIAEPMFRDPGPFWRAPQRRPEGPPITRVNIGRIEVRAALPPEPPQPAPRPPRPGPALSLEAYLKRRDGKQP
jgi:hypothetical protein